VNPESRTGKRDESGRERVVLGISQARSDFREPTCDDWKKFGKNKRAYVVAHELEKECEKKCSRALFSLT